MKHECHCCEHDHGHEKCSCRHDEAEDYSPIDAMFGLNDGAPDDALALLQTEMNECDDLSELLGLGRYPDVDDILSEAIAELSPKKKKTLMNLAVILHDYLPD